MTNNLDVSKYSEIDKPEDYLELLNEINVFLERGKEAKAVLMKAGLQYMEDNKTRSFPAGDGVEYVKKEKATKRFETAEIYKILGCPKELIDVLPKNPTFRKTAILENDKTAEFFSEEMHDVLEIAKIDKKFMGGKK